MMAREIGFREVGVRDNRHNTKHIRPFSSEPPTVTTTNPSHDNGHHPLKKSEPELRRWLRERSSSRINVRTGAPIRRTRCGHRCLEPKRCGGQKQEDCWNQLPASLLPSLVRDSVSEKPGKE